MLRVAIKIEKVYMTKVRYKKKNKVVHEHINVIDDWVLDTFGKNIAKKLIDCWGRTKNLLNP
jgi:hypothetical protein